MTVYEEILLRSIIPVHISPSPVKPSLHLQTNEPRVFKQVAASLQLCVPTRHSFVSITK